MSRNKKLRLLVTTSCPHNCPLCYNKSYDLEQLQCVRRWDYQQIMITGGEPLSNVPKVIELIRTIRNVVSMQGTAPELFLYTSVCDDRLQLILNLVDGVVVTPHGKDDVKAFIATNNLLLQSQQLNAGYNVSLRLNLFDDIKAMMPEDIDLSVWQVKHMEWLKECPVPVGEDFRRINNLW